MESSWYNLGACGENKYLQSLCAYRKPYFMIYVYDETKDSTSNTLKKVMLNAMLSINVLSRIYIIKILLQKNKKIFFGMRENASWYRELFHESDL